MDTVSNIAVQQKYKKEQTNSSTFFIIVLFIMLSTTFSIYGQNIIKGIVIDENDQPIEFANVVLYLLPDSLMINGTITGIKGQFSLQTEITTNAFLQISFIGYETRTAEVKPLQTIVLKAENTQLGEVVIHGSRKVFKIENGNIVANVKNTVLETLTNANEVIAQLPFVSGKDDDFTVFGKGKPVVYINNRLVRDNKELEQLSPGNIKNIQVIMSPGAAYDATAKAVIKIITEKPVGEGLSGMLYVRGQQASVFSGGEYISLNHRTGAWDIFGSAFYNHHKYKTDFDATQHMLLPGNEQQQIYKNNEKAGYNSLNSVIGLNFNPNKKHSTGIRYTNLDTKWWGNISNDIKHTGNNISEKILQESSSSSPRNTHSVNAYYNGVLTEKLSVNIHSDVVTGNEEDNMDAFYTQSPNEILRTKGTRDYNLYAAKGILSYAVENEVLDLGTEYSHTRVLQTYNINDPELGIENTNDKAIQNRTALFVAYQRQMGKIGLNAGIRYENIVMDYFQNNIKNEEQSKKYNKFFPNISLLYANDHFQTTVGFERKVLYPSYNQLKSNVQYSSPFIYESGNPLLQPQIENLFSAMFTWKALQAMIGYSINEDAMQPIPQQFKDEPIILLRDENVKRSRSANVGLSYSPAIGIWRPQFESGIMWQRLDLEDIEKNYNKPIFSGKWFNTFSFPQKWTLRVDASGRSAGHSGVAFMQASWGIDLKVAKKFLQDRLSLQFAANDIFKTNTVKWEMDYGKINMLYDKNIDSRSVSLTVTYRFNSTTNKYKGQQASDEINRLN
jgi:hypothetical protein